VKKKKKKKKLLESFSGVKKLGKNSILRTNAAAKAKQFKAPI
jgi:hypothetical protein